MVLTRSLLAASAILAFAVAHVPDLGKRAPIVALGFEGSFEEQKDEPYALDEGLAAFAPPTVQGKPKNATMPMLKDRSLELVADKRQLTCDAGYWYCPVFGRCCPRSTLCCSYGYCIDPDDTCCPEGACDPGWDCCLSNCSPPDGQCCRDGNYCEAGNMCVILGSNGRMVCCTDLECTAAVVSGTTSYVSSTDPPTFTTDSPPDVPSITPPPVPPETTDSSRSSIVIPSGNDYTTWYWTVTWWYLSFYWTSFRATSTVDYTTVTETTTFTTTATDREEASSLFSALSATLTFTPPASAQTSLLTYLSQDVPEETSTFSFDDELQTSASTEDEPTTTGTSTTTTETETETETSTTETSGSSTAIAGGGGGAASGVFVQWSMLLLGAISGVLMVAL